MEEKEIKVEEKKTEESSSEGKVFEDGYVVSVCFSNNRPYYFHTYDASIKKGMDVVVETVRGIELGHIVQDAKDIKEFEEFKAPLKSVTRVATKEDLKAYKDNLIAAEKAFDVCKNLVEELKLDMRLLKAEYTLDATKVIIIYVSDNRVDFRELLKELASKLKCRIELRQIGTRDRSKIVGGIGVCGLPLCCNSFLGEFDGISINMAKNQFLALNIQKLSGHCGKLICCLKYEDDQYTELRKGLPKVGFRLRYDNQQFKITSINILTRQVRLENQEAIIALPLDDVMKLYQEQVGEKKNDK